MPRRRVLCAGGCGKLVEPGTGSGEKVTCRPCRREFPKALPILVCEQCGEAFERYVAPGAGRLPRFCSRKCFSDSRPHGGRKASARARRAIVASTRDGVTDEQIWDRDDWACLIPGCELGPLRADLKHPDPLSPTVDHIVPFSRGGTDIASNKRGAHFFCNGSRNNRMHPDDVPAVTVEMAPLGLLPMPVRKPKTVHLCSVCHSAPVKSEGARCRACYQIARAAARDEMRQEALAMREQGMPWQQIADLLKLSGPGAARNVAYPPWDRYAVEVR